MNSFSQISFCMTYIMVTFLDVLLYISIVILIVCALAILIQLKCKARNKRTGRRNVRANRNICNGRRQRMTARNNPNRRQNSKNTFFYTSQYLLDGLIFLSQYLPRCRTGKIFISRQLNFSISDI